MRFDQVAKDLLAGAKYIEQHGFPPADPHPLRAVSMALGEVPHESVYVALNDAQRARYFAAADRLHECAGFDNSDLTPEEAIDVLVAAAYWEIP
jgi:hypothetical protein